MATMNDSDHSNIQHLDPAQLTSYVCEQLGYSNELRVFEDNNIFGSDFIDLSREDIAVLFPGNFILGMRMYKLVQKLRKDQTSLSLTDSDMDSQYSSSSARHSDRANFCSSAASEHGSSNQPRQQRMERYSDMQSTNFEGSSAGPTSSSRTVLPENETSELPQSKRRKVTDTSTFSLPVFSEDIEEDIANDSILTTQSRNKVIRECCRALQGHCRKNGIPISNKEKQFAARLLNEVCPNSLGNQENLYMQILRWFQNNSYCIKKCKSSLGTAKKKESSVPARPVMVEDSESIERHKRELSSEWTKSNRGRSSDKITRLLSLTYCARHADLVDQSLVSRVTKAMQEYPMLTKPLYLVQELFHTQASTFQNVAEIQAKVLELHKQWNFEIVHPLISLAKKTGSDHYDDDIPCLSLNEQSVFCLKFLLERLKIPKGKVLPIDERLKLIFMFAKTQEEGAQISKNCCGPTLVCIGKDIAGIESQKVVLEKRIVADVSSSNIVSGLLIMFAVYFTYDVAYSPQIKLPLTYLQEKFLRIPLSSSKIPISYSNFFRAVSCVEKSSDIDFDETQEAVLFEQW